jgi:hypothetical protein
MNRNEIFCYPIPLSHIPLTMGYDYQSSYSFLLLATSQPPSFPLLAASQSTSLCVWIPLQPVPQDGTVPLWQLRWIRCSYGTPAVLRMASSCWYASVGSFFSTHRQCRIRTRPVSRPVRMLRMCSRSYVGTISWLQRNGRVRSLRIRWEATRALNRL